MKDPQELSRPVRLFADALHHSAGKGAAGLITSKVLWGSVIPGGSLLLSGSEDALVDQLSQCHRDIITPEAADALPVIPKMTAL